MSVLRQQTREQHEALESALNLLAPPLSRDRFLRVLSRFYGFHRVWEPAVAAHVELRAFMDARHRLPLLRRDLRALGLSEDAIDALPLCEDAASCVAETGEALGSLYVLEGSTLGGQIITRALSQEDWTPPQGLTSFNPYREETGRMWRDFRTFAEAQGRGRDAARIVAGARQTFVLLTGWLTT
ncbi:MAG: Heme oxygenase [Hyphomicrobiales bacterium]|nr:Heme oxygenase [Hyphomicrobiales bacterium]